MPRQCATGPQYGAMPDPWSPAVRKYINDGLDDETLGKPTEAQPPSSLEETVEGIKNGTLSGATLNMNGTQYDGVGIAVGVNNMAIMSPQSLSSEKVNSLKQQFMAGHSPVEKIGFWVDENNEVSIDLSLVLPPEQMELAKTIGTYTRQNSIYDIETDVETKLGFSGNNNRDLTLEELNVVREMIEELSMRTNSPEDISKTENILDYLNKNNHHSHNINIWRDIRKADAAQRKEEGKLQGKLLDAAIQVMEGRMTIPQFRKLSQEINPIIPITAVPTTASLADVVRALTKNKSENRRIIGLPNVNIRDGESVGFRLDIPAYESYNVWVNAIHIKGQKNMYSNASVGNNAIFGNNSKQALKVATGTPKSPFAVIDVAWENQNIEQTEQEITRALQDSQQENSTWKQIGFNPNRSGYFYDKANLKPVASASRVLQLGPLVMAQNVQYVPTEEANVKFSPSGGKIVPSSVIKNSRPNYEMQRALNIVPPSEALLEKGTYAKDMVDANNKSITQKENDKYYGRFYHYLQSSVTPEAWQMLVKWSTPTAILWDANTDPNISTNQPAKNFYHAASDIIYLNTSPSLSLISNKPLERDVEQAVVHEFSHFGDKQLGFPSQSEAFIEAFNQDATNLGILVPLDSPFRDASTKVEMDSITREYAIDEAINNFIFYNYMLHHPNEFQKLIDELSNTNSAIETQNIIDVSNFKIPLPPPTGTGLTQTKLEHRVSSNKGKRSKHFESFWKNNRRKPTNDEMIEQVQASHYILQETKTLDDVYLAREKLYEKLTKEHNSLAEKGNYLHGYFDIIDAMTGGRSHTRAYLPGHGIDYYRKMENRYSEVFANIMEAWMNVDPRGLERIQKEFPKLTAATLSIIEANKGRTIPPSNPEFPRDGRWGNQTSRSVM
jgi:hypothetical protein